MREWLTVIIVLLIVAVILDGIRRMRQARRSAIRMSRNVYKENPVASETNEYGSELPSGGARVVDVRQPEVARQRMQEVRESFVRKKKRVGRPYRIPEQVTLNLDEHVPTLMESVEMDSPVKSKAKPASPARGDARHEHSAPTSQAEIFDDNRDGRIEPRFDSPLELEDEDESAPRHSAVVESDQHGNKKPDTQRSQASSPPRELNGNRESFDAQRDRLAASAVKDGSRRQSEFAAELQFGAADGGREDFHTSAAAQQTFTASRDFDDFQLNSDAEEYTAADLDRAHSSLESNFESFARERDDEALDALDRASDYEDDDEYDEVEEDYREPDVVLVINVMAPKGQRFPGDRLLGVVLSQGMRFGSMNIFHRHEEASGEGPILYSMANIVVPGTFDLNNMKDFSTPGISLFMALPLEADSADAFEKMLTTARALGQHLGGELKDENRSVLTSQTIEHYRGRIREFERKQLSRAPA